MSRTKKITLKKLKRARLWPSVMIFATFTVVSVLLVLVGIQLLSTYILDTKLSAACSQAVDTGAMFERIIRDQGEPVDRVFDISGWRAEWGNVYVTDQQGNRIASTGSSEPDLSQKDLVTLGESYDLYPGKQEYTQQDEEAVNVWEIMKSTFDELPSDGVRNRVQWMGETVMEMTFWVNVHWDIENYRLYVEKTIALQRQDIYYIFRLGLGALFILLMPLLFMFIHTLIGIYTQRVTTKLLYTDAVTGGYNWIYFQGAAFKTLEAIRNAQKCYALVDLHLVHYDNYVNFYGSEEGEKLLECMDGFLEARMESTECFGHYGDADFAVLLNCQDTTVDACRQQCYDRLHALLAELSSLKPERKLHFRAGVYLLEPIGDRDIRERLRSRRRDVNLNQIFSYACVAQRRSNRSAEQIHFFDMDLLEEQNWEQWVENHMQPALTAGEFEVYYQPKYAPVSGRMVGAEALVRWKNKEHGMIPPGRFIPIFEENGFITRLDDYMISRVAQQQSEWAVQGKKAVPVSVNVSRIHFTMDDLAEHITRVVDAYGARHQMIDLEITESAFFDDKKQLVETASRLRTYGFQLSMDDFGAGYSSLNTLKEIPLDTLKLDAEFFRGEDPMGHGKVIVKEAVCLAHQMGMRVVAEGVEQKTQVDFLAGIGCDMIQGYYYAKPMPLEEFEQLMEQDV